MKLRNLFRRTIDVYVFECDFCRDFYGEATLEADGRLLCPSCEAEQNLDSSYIEKMKTYR